MPEHTMKDLLRMLVEGERLDREQAGEAFDAVMRGEVDPAAIGGLLSMLSLRGPTVDEIAGAADAMRKVATPVTVPDGLTPIDIVGTGGDHSDTFNISTAASIVTAAAARPEGVCVAKHGNRAVTSKSGASQVLEALGVTLTADGDTLTRCLDQIGLCFCYAPHHHPAMKHAGPVRAALGFRTIFNLVGPLTNPAGVRRLVMGVYARDRVRPMAEVLQSLSVDRAMVVHGQIPDTDGVHIDGFDELSTCGPTSIAEVGGSGIAMQRLDPTDLGLSYSHPSVLRVDSPAASAAVIRKVLDNRGGPAEDVVALNAGAALIVAGLAGSFEEGLGMAVEAIQSGAAAQTLEKLVALTGA